MFKSFYGTYYECLIIYNLFRYDPEQTDKSFAFEPVKVGDYWCVVVWVN